jgi:hypothetical protein
VFVVHQEASLVYGGEPRFEVTWWLDCDAVTVDLDLETHHLAQSGKDFVLSSDAKRCLAAFSAGVLGLRNTETARALVAFWLWEWQSQLPRWRQTDSGEWKVRNKKTTPFAGPAYEQGALCELVVEAEATYHQECADTLQRVSSAVLQGDDKTAVDLHQHQAVNHFFGDRKKYTKAFLKRFPVSKAELAEFRRQWK